MKSKVRPKIEGVINDVNNTLDTLQIGVKFSVLAYGQTSIADQGKDTQVIINKYIAESDILILVTDNGKKIGNATMEEYKVAHEQSKKSGNNLPHIKAFALLNKNGEDINILYEKEDGTEEQFETRLYNDSGRYMQCIEATAFKETLKNWLLVVAQSELNRCLTQKELDYGCHIGKIGQDWIRENNDKYYRRDKLDGEIETILETSPIVILEGNTYSGKTRAAFELMRRNENWKDYDFHIYGGGYDSIEDLNRLHLNVIGGKDVYLFDDINAIIKDPDKINRRASLWAKLNGYNINNGNTGFSLSDFGNTRIIITVAGSLSPKERYNLYCSIFNTRGYAFKEALKEIIVNFDIYDCASFHQLVDAMKRDGIINKGNLRSGNNYTIGSLFTKDEEVKDQIRDEYEANASLLTALVGHFKYASKTRFAGLLNEIQELYDYIIESNRTRTQYEYLTDGIERLRQKGIVVNGSNNEERVHIDEYILNLISDVIVEKGTSNLELNRILVEYATECEKKRGNNSSLDEYHICYIAQMGYLLVQHNSLPDEELIHLAGLVKSNLLNTKFDSISLTGNSDKREIGAFAVKMIEIAKQQDDYAIRFASSVVASINDFDLAFLLIEAYYKYYESKGVEVALKLHKESAYTMFSASKRSMTMAQERKVLSLILDENEGWKAPFSEEDLKDIFYLERITPFLTKKSAKEIIELLPTATIDGCDIANFDKEYADYNSNSQNSNVSNSDKNDDFGFDELPTSSTQEDYDERNRYEKIYLNQVREATIAALKRVNSFEEFEEVIGTINNMRNEESKEYSVHIKRAVNSAFAYPFYKTVPEIAERLQFNDRAKLFDFIFNIDESNISENAITHKSKRIACLNKLLKYLDENKALSGYKKMINENLYDSHSLSMLSNNSELGFESLFELNNDEHSNFITLNQLLGKAETLSDAHACLRLMGIKDGDPCKLKDENALIKYLKIKRVDSRRCIEIIKGQNKDLFSDNILTALLSKLDIDILIDIFFPNDENSKPNYYKDKYGLSDKNIENARKNAILLNKLIYRLNGEKVDYSNSIEQKYQEIINSDELKHLITDSNSDKDNSILSVYMKNLTLYKNYDEVKKFYTDLLEKFPKIRTSENIYSVFIWHIVEGYKNESYNKEEAIELMNAELKSAYNDFANNYPKRDVIKMMAKLYHYRPLLIDNFEAKEKFAYENQELELNYKGYLEHLKKNNKDYVDGTFIYNSLSIMKESIDEDIYKLLGEIAKANRMGVQYDTIFKNRNDKTRLSAEVQKRLLSFDNDNNELHIDSNFIYNASQIKILWLLLKNGHIDIDSAEDYRKKAGLPITQTYLNMVFKFREQKIRNDNKRARYRIEIQEEGFNSLVSFLNEHITDDSTHLHRSIEMCISLIGVAPNENTLNSIFEDCGFGDFEYKTEVITARMNKILNLRNYKNIKEDENRNQKTAFKTLNKFREVIINNCDKINIYTVNTYLRVYIMALKKELFDPTIKNEDIDYRDLEYSWRLLKDERKIDMFELLNVDDYEESTIAKRLGLGADEDWLIDANVQTFSYFAKYDQQLISTMDKAFDGNFCYDGEKSCLKDAIKNYSYFYNNKENNYPKEEAYKIAEILSRKENEKVLNEICDEYIIKSEKKSSDLWKSIDFLWQDLLECSDFKKKAILYICRLAKEMPHHKGRHTPNFAKLDINDNNRICTLKECFSSNDLDSYTLEAIDSCLKEINDAVNNQDEQIRANAEKALNIFKSIFHSVRNQQVS